MKKIALIIVLILIITLNCHSYQNNSFIIQCSTNTVNNITPDVPVPIVPSTPEPPTFYYGIIALILYGLFEIKSFYNKKLNKF